MTMLLNPFVIGGPAPGFNGVVFDYSFPLGLSGTYVPKKADTLVCASGIALNTGSPVTITTAGVAYLSSVNFGSMYDLSSVPAKATSIRLYEVWGTMLDPVVTEAGIQMLFNYVDGNNYFEMRFLWYSGNYRMYLGRIVGGSFSFFGSTPDLGIPGAPGNWYCALYDTGDRLYFGAHAFETDTTTDVGAEFLTVTEVSRPGKTATRTFLRDGSITVTPGNLRVRGFRITDL